MPTEPCRYYDRCVPIFRQNRVDIPTEMCRYSDRKVPIFRQKSADIPTEPCRYSDRKVPIFRQNRVDIPTEVCRYSDTIFTHIVGITGFQDCRNSGTPAIPTCRKNDTLLSELRYILVGISIRRNKGTSE